MALSALTISGCRESYLDLKDTTSISDDVFPTSLDNVNLIVNSVYGAQRNWFFMGHYWAGYCQYPVDHTIDMQWRGTKEWISICTGDGITSGNTMVTNPFRAFSEGVYFSNVALEGIEKYRAMAPQSEQSTLDMREGETLFFRAYYRWHMLQWYGEPEMTGMGIPIINSTPSTLSDMQVSRATTAESYQAILDDLLKAEPLLEGQNDNHRVTKWSVKAFLAKVYLFMNDKDNCKKYLEDCINNSGKSLVSYDAYKNMFNGDEAYEYNSESFFEMGNKEDGVTGNSYGGLNTGTSMPILYSAMYINTENNSRQAMSYSNEFMHDRNLVRFGYTDPVPLTQKVGKGTKDDPYRLSDSYIAQQRRHREMVGREQGGPDPRLYVCALQPFFDTVTINGNRYPVAQEEFGDCWTMSKTTGNDSTTFYGWPLRKYQYLKGLMTEVRNCPGNNIYFIRLPEIYLWYAEIIKDSNPTLALEYVNKVRRRAYNYPVDTPSPVDYKSLTDRTNTADPTDELANNPLLYELWAETFGEMHWWETVRRLDLRKGEAEFYKTVHGPGTDGYSNISSTRRFAMPISPLELENNTKMQQTHGYD